MCHYRFLFFSTEYVFLHDTCIHVSAHVCSHTHVHTRISGDSCITIRKQEFISYHYTKVTHWDFVSFKCLSNITVKVVDLLFSCLLD